MLVDPNEPGVLAGSPPPAPDANSRSRVDALADEAWSIRFTDRDRADALAREALALAEAEGYGVGIALALRTLGVHRYYFGSDYEGALDLLQRALVLLDSAGEVRGRADVLNGIGYIHVRRGEHLQGVRLHFQALEIQRATHDLVGESNTLTNLGTAAYLAGDYGPALEHLEASLMLRERIGDRTATAYSLMNIGVVHGQLGDLERLLEYMNQALAIHQKGDVQAARACLMNMGNAYMQLGQYDRGLSYLDLALKSMSGQGPHLDHAHCLRVIGQVHERRGDEATALSYFEQSLEMAHGLDARVFEPEILIHIGRIKARLGDVISGLAHVRQALVLAEAHGDREHVHEAHEALAEAYERQGDAARALEHHRAFHSIWREVYGTETNLRIQNVRVRAEVQQTQREAEILREKNEALTRADEEKARLLEQLRTQAAELERQTREDALTGVFNRRHLDTLLSVEWERALRFGRALTVAMLDVDHFKQVNDRFSHAVGDEVLRTVARILRENTRGVDVVARYGGEEFCLILVETRVDEGARLCDRLRTMVQAHDWSTIRPGLAVTVSIGVAGLHEAEAPDALLSAADARLYAAKHAGRNRVCAA
jgi:diguanylate cyclase (GGDEF)-like protein